MLNNMGYGLGVSLYLNRDTMSPGFMGVTGKYTFMKKMFETGRSKITGIFGKLGGVFNRFSGGASGVLNKISGLFHNFVGGALRNLGGLNTAMLGSITKFGPWAVAIGVGVVAAVKLIKVLNEAAKISEKFQEKMADIATLISGNSKSVKNKIDELTVSIENAQMKYGMTADSMTEGTYQIISAFGEGVDAASLLEVHTKAAAAGASTLKEATDLLSAVSKGYGDTSIEMQKRISDLSFQTVKLGQTTFPELASSMGKVVPLASTMNISLEELYGTFATLTGVTGTASEVSTQMSSILGAMIKPSKELTKVVQGLGYESAISMMKQEGMYKSLDMLWKVTGKNEKAFGKLIRRKEGLVAAFALLQGQADVFKDKLSQMNKAVSDGATDEAFKKIADTRAFERKQMEQTEAVFMQRLGRIFLPFRSKWYKTKTFFYQEMIKYVAVFKKEYADPMAKIFSPYLKIFGVYFKLVTKLFMFMGKSSLKINGLILKYVFFPFRIGGAVIMGVIKGIKLGLRMISPHTAKIRSSFKLVSDAVKKIRDAFDTAFGYGNGSGLNMMKNLTNFIAFFMIPGFKLLGWILLGVSKAVGFLAKGTVKVIDLLSKGVNNVIAFGQKLFRNFLYPVIASMEYLGMLNKGTADLFMKEGLNVVNNTEIISGKKTTLTKKVTPRVDNKTYMSDEQMEELGNKLFEGAREGTKKGSFEGITEGKEKDMQGGWEYDYLVRNFIPVF